MPFRARLKHAFRRSSTASSNSTNDGSLQTKSSSHEEHLDPNDPSVYKPHEMPRPKYRSLPDKKHREKLEAFSFASSWRSQGDTYSLYSPGGSRLSSRAASVHEERFDSSGPRTVWNGGKGGVERVEEVGNDGDGTRNVGIMTRKHIVELAAPDPISNMQAGRGQDGSETNLARRRVRNAHDHTPFTESEIALALERSRTRPPISLTS